MGHLVGKDIYRRLGKKVDNLTMRAPWNETLHAILKELYTPEEAELLVAMPYGMSTLERLKRVTRMEEGRLLPLLEGMCDKGLVIDLLADERMHYAPSPIVIGFFEFTMMRTGRAGLKELSHLFHEYMMEDPAFLDANLGNGEQVNVMRTMPHKEALGEEYLEVLDFERTEELIDRAKLFAVSTCSCRHEMLHLGHPSLPGAAGVVHLIRARGAVSFAAQPGEGDFPGGDAGALRPVPRHGARLLCGQRAEKHLVRLPLLRLLLHCPQGDKHARLREQRGFVVVPGGYRCRYVQRVRQMRCRLPGGGAGHAAKRGAEASAGHQPHVLSRLRRLRPRLPDGRMLHGQAAAAGAYPGNHVRADYPPVPRSRHPAEPAVRRLLAP